MMDPFFLSNEMSWVGGGAEDDFFKKGESLSHQIQQKPLCKSNRASCMSPFKSEATNSLCLGLKLRLVRIHVLILMRYFIASLNKYILSCELSIINSSRIFKSIQFYPLSFEQTRLYYTFTVLWDSSVLFSL